jgi:hypothetical protein
MGFPFGFAFEFHALDLTTPEKHLGNFHSRCQLLIGLSALSAFCQVRWPMHAIILNAGAF